MLLPILTFAQQSDTPLVKYQWGVLVFDPDIMCKLEIMDKYGFCYKRVADCEVSTKELAKWERHNRKIDRKLKRKNGKEWKERFWEEIENCVNKT